MLHSTLQQIISAIEITSAGQIIVNEQPQMADYLFIPPSENKNTQIKKLLSDIIYQKFYCQHSENEAIILSEKAFIQSLKKSNLSKNKLIDGFKVLYADTDGSIIVEKKQLRKRVPAGMYLRKQGNDSAIEVGEIVKLYSHHSFLDSKNAFYHVFGETPDIDFPEAMVRFYFHLKPMGSPVLIQKLGQVFNTRKIFFQFKCLKNPSDYTRADAGVLYMYKFDWEQLYPALAQVFEEINPYLKEETPLFALPIAKGIAFGENPKDARQSFGTQRCELIAEAIFLAQNKPKDLWTESVMEHLKGKGFDLDRFYLNPNSSFVYGF